MGADNNTVTTASVAVTRVRVTTTRGFPHKASGGSTIKRRIAPTELAAKPTYATPFGLASVTSRASYNFTGGAVPGQLPKTAVHGVMIT